MGALFSCAGPGDVPASPGALFIARGTLAGGADGSGADRASERPEHAVRAQRQRAEADAGGVVDGVGDRGRGADDADLADPLGAHGVQVRVLLLEPDRVDVADV